MSAIFIDIFENTILNAALTPCAGTQDIDMHKMQSL